MLASYWNVGTLLKCLRIWNCWWSTDLEFKHVGTLYNEACITQHLIWVDYSWTGPPGFTSQMLAFYSNVGAYLKSPIFWWPISPQPGLVSKNHKSKKSSGSRLCTETSLVSGQQLVMLAPIIMPGYSLQLTSNEVCRLHATISNSLSWIVTHYLSIKCTKPSRGMCFTISKKFQTWSLLPSHSNK